LKNFVKSVFDLNPEKDTSNFSSQAHSTPITRKNMVKPQVGVDLDEIIKIKT
jgi:hypothetical protein